MAYVTKRGNRYTGYFVDPLGKRRSAGTYDSRAEAAEQAARAQQDPRRAERNLVEYQSYSGYVSTWLLTDNTLLLSTKKGYESNLKKHVLPRLGRLFVGEIDNRVVRTLLQDLESAGIGPTVRAQCKAAIGSSFHPLVPKIIPVNPTHGIRVHVPPAKPFGLVDIETFQRIAVHLKPGAQLFASFLVLSGSRFGEAAEIRVKDLNLRTSEVSILRRVTQVGRERSGGQRYVVIDGTKAGRHRGRSVVLPAQFVTSLVAWIQENQLESEDLIFPNLLIVPLSRQVALLEATRGESFINKGKTFIHGTTSGYGSGACRCELCRTAVRLYRRKYRAAQKALRRGPPEHLANDRWRRVWRAAIEQSGIGWYPRTHDLRHAHATHLVASGLSVYEVKERLGHQSIETTMKYQHRVDAQKSKAVEMIAQFISTTDQVGDSE